MGHLVLGYPSLDDSYRTACLYADLGVSILELQIPFSDPSADGPVITEANTAALAAGATVDACLALLAQLRQEYPRLPIVPMTYANKVFARKPELLAAELLALGIDHIIVPDLPCDDALAARLHAAGLKTVPVLAANTPLKRLPALLAQGPRWGYLMSGFQITGQGFDLNPDVPPLVAEVRRLAPEIKLGVGFGISERAHLQALAAFADFGIIGSAWIRARRENRLEETIRGMYL